MDPYLTRGLTNTLYYYYYYYNVSPVYGPSERISALEVGLAIGKMKQGKSAGPMGVVAEMLKAAGETGTLWMTDMCNAVVKDGKVPEAFSQPCSSPPLSPLWLKKPSLDPGQSC